MAFLILKERLKILNVAGLIISISGVLIILLDKDLSANGSSYLGIIFLFGAVLASVGHGIMLKKLTFHYSPLMIITSQNIIGLFYFIPLVAMFSMNHLSDLQIDTRLITNLTLLGVFASSLAYVFFARSVQVFGISKSSLYANLIPVFTAIFSYLLLNETISILKFVGMFIVIFGVILSEFNFKQNKKIQL
jgi:drug/metabolite transporter (DMT)-like permease